MTLVEKIKSLCLSTGDTLASLEKKLGFGNATIRKWDKAVPSGDRLTKVAEYFNISVDYLLGLEESEGLNSAYFRVMKDAQEKGYSPHDIQLALDFIKRARERDKQ
jgi:transcriptional regulator with XRE-family HTH domain